MARSPTLTLVAVLIMAGTGAPLRAETCGPDALGTSRVMSVGTAGGLRVGLKTYPRSLPLKDHEVVLTFDDGPAPETTAKILDALARECVRATFFVIGRAVELYPDLARREAEEGHTIAHHTYSHPQPTMRAMTAAEAREDVVHGMAVVEREVYGVDVSGLAAGDLASLKVHTPFFRFPGFAETADLSALFAAHNIGTFGTDIWAADWLKMTPQQELRAILARLDQAGRGMILLHDDKPWTAAMLPDFLRALKARGFRIVHLVAGRGAQETAPAPEGWKAQAPP
jgi:peptidoglycan-N-acetylglucosamine deacetylase